MSIKRKNEIRPKKRATSASLSKLLNTLTYRTFVFGVILAILLNVTDNGLYALYVHAEDYETALLEINSKTEQIDKTEIDTATFPKEIIFSELISSINQYIYSPTPINSQKTFEITYLNERISVYSSHFSSHDLSLIHI